MSLEDWHRRRHRDLAALTDLDLDRELFGVAARLYRDHEPGRVAWLIERRDAVRTERDARRRRRPTPEPVGVTWRRGQSSAPPAVGGWAPAPIRGGGRRGR